jgi:hypothetical protein
MTKIFSPGARLSFLANSTTSSATSCWDRRYFLKCGKIRKSETAAFSPCRAGTFPDFSARHRVSLPAHQDGIDALPFFGHRLLRAFAEAQSIDGAIRAGQVSVQADSSAIDHGAHAPPPFTKVGF